MRTRELGRDTLKPSEMIIVRQKVCAAAHGEYPGRRKGTRPLVTGGYTPYSPRSPESITQIPRRETRDKAIHFIALARSPLVQR